MENHKLGYVSISVSVRSTYERPFLDWYAVRLLECWRDPIYYARVGHSLVSVLCEPETLAHSGYHPFDFSRGSSCKSWWPSEDLTPSQKNAESQAHPSSQNLSQSEWGSTSTSEKGEGVVKQRIIDGHVDFHGRVWSEEVSKEARELVTVLLVYDYLERATVYGALRAAWIVQDEVALRDAYRKRISAELF